MSNQSARWTRIWSLCVAITFLGCVSQRIHEERITIPVGTTIAASLETPLASDRNHAGDPFTARSLEPLAVDGKTAIPAGSEIRGTIREVEQSGRVKGRARMTLTFGEIVDPNGTVRRIDADPITFMAKSGTRGDIEKLAAGGITGAILGGIVGGKSGAVKGTAVGAGAGTVWVLTTKGDDVELDQGHRLSVRITGPLEVPIVAQTTTKGGD